jgi:alkanesulfonate monooxygenase SsuD/methylene tetrahydromethanopterin reductase-like flavin-dependent oxidoreductase (luciferase family)
VKAWTATTRFSHHGRFWHFDDVVVEPPTRQKPHPPLWMAAASEPSLRRVAARQHKLILDQFASIELTGQRLAFFRREVEAHGLAFDPMSVTVARDMHVATSQADKDAAIARSKGFHQRILNVARSPTREGGSHILAYSHATEESAAASLIGTPDEIVAKIEALRRGGVAYVILSCGGSRENLRRFARDIMPAFATERTDYADASPV